MIQKRITVFAPATISNLGSGFDVLGIAIDRPGDMVTAYRQRAPGLSFSVRTNHANVPAEPQQNVAAHVANLMLEEFQPPFGIRMVLHKKMPIGSGLGSSAASSVASVVAVNGLLEKRLKKSDLLRFAVEGERMASGAPHADNVAPSLLGGACLIRSYSPLDVISLPLRNSVVWVVVHPRIVVRTEEARRVLPAHVPLESAIRQWGNVSGLTVGLSSGDARLIGKCVEDVIVEPLRAHLIPGFFTMKQSALDAGATGCSISGSGPSLFAVAASMAIGRRIAAAMADACSHAARVPCDVYISKVNTRGATILRKG